MGVRKERKIVSMLFCNVIKNKDSHTQFQLLNNSEFTTAIKKKLLSDFLKNYLYDISTSSSILIEKHLFYFLNRELTKCIEKINKDSKNKNPTNRQENYYSFFKFMISCNIINNNNFDLLLNEKIYFDDEVFLFIINSPEVFSPLYFKYINYLNKNKLTHQRERFRIKIRNHLFREYLLSAPGEFYPYVLQDLSITVNNLIISEPELNWDFLFETKYPEKIIEYFTKNPSQGDLNRKNVFANYFLKYYSMYKNKNLNIENLHVIAHFCNFNIEHINILYNNIKTLHAEKIIDSKKLNLLTIEIARIKAEKEDAIIKKNITSCFYKAQKRRL